MPLSAGARIGSFEVLSCLGAGGMGEVYRARDTKLGRDVALKILPETFALDSDRLMRFRREAHVLASLNHTNIAHLYGLEEDGRTTALVMELVEGPTLAERIAQGPIPLDDALTIARQIVQALDAAHERGIVHRDLKPANVKVTEDGTVKVLDFGLAKALDPSADGNLANSPTITSPAMTARGVILGTAAYMAPEQAKGRSVDKRADIFAFGVVLYEMLTGRRLFQGETVSELLASVIKEDPSLETVPASVRPLLRKCLEKDPKKRLRDIGDVWLLFDDQAEPAARVGRRWLPWALAAGIAVVSVLSSIAALRWMTNASSPFHPTVVQFDVDVPQGAYFSTPYIASVSPDGQWLLFGAFESASTPSRLWLRSVRSGVVRAVEGTEGAGAPFWSPDSRSFAFPVGVKLKRGELAGGTPVEVCDLPGSSLPGTWNRAGTMLLSGGDGLYTVSASGGTPSRLTKLDASGQEHGHVLPEFLPDGRRFLFFVQSEDPNTRGVYVASLDAPETRHRVVASDAKATFVPPRLDRGGALLYIRGSALVAHGFDAEQLRVEGDAVIVADGLRLVLFNQGFAGQAPFWSSPAGVLLYRKGTLSYAVNWVDRNGRRSTTGIATANYADLRLSPDDSRVAVGRRDGSGMDMWNWDFSRSGWTRLSLGAQYANFPAWSGDGRQVVFSTGARQKNSVSVRDADASGETRVLIEGTDLMTVQDWSRDGRFILYTQAADIWAIPVQASVRKPTQLISGPLSEKDAKFSPVGNWVSFTSNESGREEVYVQSFTETAPNALSVSGRRWPVSRNGGSTALWRGDGKELYFISSDNKMMAAEVQLAESVTIGPTRELFSATFMTLNVLPYGVTSDGQRFLVLEAQDRGLHPPFTVALNWQDALEK